MKNLFLSVVFLLTVSFTYANNSIINNNDVTISQDLQITSHSNFSTEYTISFEDDVCTITVTIVTSGGSYSATASNNQGNCTAAYNAAYDMAYTLCVVFGPCGAKK